MSEEPERRRILALGGGGFTTSSEDWALDEYVLSLVDRERPRICLLPTASGDSAEQIERFYGAFGPHACELSHVSLFRLGTDGVDLRGHLLSRDAIYVGGGSMKNLLALWRVHGLDIMLADAWETGIVLCGVSAGSMCWFQYGITRTHGSPVIAEGLGVLPGGNSVHYGSDPLRGAAFREQIAGGAPPGWAVDDGVGLLFAGRTLVEAVTAREGAQAVWMELRNGEAVSHAIEPRVLRGDLEATPGPEPIAISEYRETARWRSYGRECRR